jgi:hypothetical protein
MNQEEIVPINQDDQNSIFSTFDDDDDSSYEQSDDDDVDVEDHNITTNKDDARRGCMFAFESMSPNSKRTRQCKQLFESTLQQIDHVYLKPRTDNKKQKKELKLDSIPTVEIIDTSRFVTQAELEATPHFYSAISYSDEELQFETIPGLTRPGKVIEYKNVFDVLQLVDTLDGAKLMEDERVPIFILPPRHLLVSRSGNPQPEVNASHSFTFT